MRLFNKDRARGVATQVGSCPAIPAASNHKDAAMVQRLAVQHLRPQHLSATLPLHLVQDELAEHLPKEIRLSKGFVKKPLDETVSKGLLLVQMLVWWLGRSHKHHGQRPLLGDLQGTFITSQDIGRLECQLKTCLMVMSYDSSKWADVEHISYPTPTSVLLSGLVFRSYVSQCFTTLFLLYMSVP